MNREIRVGIMFTLAVAIFGVAVYYLGNIKEMVSYRIEFDRVGGLERDSPVQFRGVPIGRVTKITLKEEVDPSSHVPIIVTISIHRTARQHIRTSTIADIRAVGVLGDKSILLLTNDYKQPVLEEDGFIDVAPKTLDVDKLLEQGEDLVTDATVITKDLRHLLSKLANGEGSLQTLISDKKLAEDIKKTLGGALSYFEEENNLLALLMKDPEFAEMVKEKLGDSLNNVAQLTETYKEPKGLLPMLLADETYRDETRKRIDKLLDNADGMVTDMRGGRGLAHKLLQDEEYGARVSENLEKASYHLASILEKIDNGEGTAAMVVNDPSLYEGLYEVVYGLQHSGLSKWYIQRKQKKGATLKAREALNEDEENP